MDKRMQITGNDLAEMEKVIKNDYQSIIKQAILFKTTALLKNMDIEQVGEFDAYTTLKAKQLVAKLNKGVEHE